MEVCMNFFLRKTSLCTDEKVFELLVKPILSLVDISLQYSAVRQWIAEHDGDDITAECGFGAEIRFDVDEKWPGRQDHLLCLIFEYMNIIPVVQKTPKNPFFSSVKMAFSPFNRH